MAADEGRTSSDAWLLPAPQPETKPASLDPPKPPFPEIPGITIAAEIGAGGMGRVYRARQEFTGREVAVKVIHATEDEAFLARFRREAKILSDLDHPNIVGCHQAGVGAASQGFLVMELVTGGDLTAWVREHGAMAPADALRVGMEVAGALRHAWRLGIIHRDLKPGNVLLAPRLEAPPGELPFTAKLADLGLARNVTEDSNLTGPADLMGTPSTMAPEQAIRPKDLDHRADIYGLGCVLFFLMAGDQAFTGETPAAILAKKLRGMLPSLRHRNRAVPPPVAQLVESMIEARPERRPATYDELIERLEALLPLCADPPPDASAAVEQEPPSWRLSEGLGLADTSEDVFAALQEGSARAGRSRRRRIALWAGAVLATILLAAGSWALKRRAAPGTTGAPAHKPVVLGGEVKVGGYVFPPFVDATPGGAHRGATLDLIAALNQRQDRFEFTFVPTTAPRRYYDATDGKIDVLFFESIAWGWKGKDVEASRVFLSGGEVYVARAAPGRGQRFFSSVKTRRIAAVLGYHYGFAGFNADPAYLRRRFDVALEPTPHACLDAVLEGRAEISVLTRSWLARTLKDEAGLAEKLLISRKLDQAYNHTVVIRRGAPIDRDAMNGLLDLLEHAGTLDALRERYEAY